MITITMMKKMMVVAAAAVAVEHFVSSVDSACCSVFQEISNRHQLVSWLDGRKVKSERIRIRWDYLFLLRVALSLP